MLKIAPAPPDLAELIETYRAAEGYAARIAAHYALLRWPGWEKRTVYLHDGMRITLVWGSIKFDGLDAHFFQKGI